MINVNADRGYLTVEVDREDRARVAALLLDLADKGDVTTVTHTRGGLGFRLPDRYREQVHGVLFPSDEGETGTGDGETVDQGKVVDEGDDVPGRNESREDWAEFLDARGIEYPTDAKRNDLIEIWDARDDSSDE